MRTSSSVKLLSATAALALFAGCSSGSAIAPTSSTMQSHHIQAMSGRLPSVVNPLEMLKLRQVGTPNHKASFDACPASGPIVYMSDFINSTINIYKVPLTGHGPCGQLTASSGLLNPDGLIVRHNDLFVANTEAMNVIAFHRGATKPYITYTDTTCSGEFPFDVTVSNDNFVFATNVFGNACAGSISIWQKQSGVLVSNIPDETGANLYFLTIQKDGTLYYDHFAADGLYKGNCAGGACGSFTNTGATFAFAGGVRSADGEDVVAVDQSAPGGGALYTFEPPNFSNPDVCRLGGSNPVSFDFNHKDNHFFVADAGLNEALEFSYPDCKLIGSAPGNSGGLSIGVAKDFPETLH